MATFGALLRPLEPYHVRPVYNYLGPYSKKVMTPHFKALLSRYPDVRYRFERGDLKGKLALHEASLREWVAANKSPTNTPEFRRWFGQSVVTERDGTPKVVFHATSMKAPKEFEYGFFRDSRVYPFRSFRVIGNTETDIGFHFGNAEQALTRIALHSSDNYKGKYVFAVYLSLKNPLRAPDLGDFKFMNMALEMRKQKLITEEQLDEFRLYYQVYKEAKVNDRVDVRVELIRLKRERERLIVRILRSKGYDGLVYNNTVEGSGTSYAVFSPAQVKAINNSGRWSRRTKDVFNGLS